MASTALTDIIVPTILNTDTNVMFAKKFDFLMMGGARRVDIGPGWSVSIRQWQELTGTAFRIVNNGAYPVQSATQANDKATVVHRGQKFGNDDLTDIVGGVDAMAQISSMVSQYWAGQTQNVYLAVLGALFNRTLGLLSTTNKSDIFSAVTPAYLTPATALAGAVKLGENMDVGVWLMHPVTYAKLLAAGYLETNHNLTAYNQEGLEIRTFMGKPVIMANSAPTFVDTLVTGYRTYGVGLGALSLGIQSAIATEIQRTTDFSDVLSTQFHFSAHVHGCKWGGVDNPTDADLATVGNWTLAYSDAKNVRVVAIDHN